MAVIFHYAYQAVCYLPFLLVMIIILLYSPALAVFPRLTQTPFLFSTAPIISISLLVGIGYMLFHLGYYQHNIVLIISLLIFILAAVRQYAYLKKVKYEWYKNARYLFVINITILLPLIAMSGLSAFMQDDALVSWNYWAKHYVNQVSPASISGGYPLAFSYFLSYCYQFLDTTEYQGIVKSVLVIIPFSLLNILAFRATKSLPSIVIYFCIAFISIFPGFWDMDFYRFYSVGYADPLLAAAVTVSAALLLNYCHYKDLLLLILASITAILASLIKQPGFLWALWGFPLILSVKMLKNKQLNLLELTAITAVMIPVLGWLIGPGRHFAHNEGVISTSLGTAHITFIILLKTLWASILKYWIEQPTLLLLYILALCWLRNTYQKIFFMGFILPGTLLWFIFGSYHIREGLYLLTCCGFLVMQQVSERDFIDLKKIRNFSILLNTILFIFFSIREQNVQHNGVEDHLYPLEASKTLIYHYFSDGAPFVYEQIFKHPSKTIWSANNLYINSIFYGNNKIITPASSDESISKVYQELITAKPDYVITAGKFHSLASDAIIKLQKICTDVLEEIFLGDPLYQIQLFRFHPDAADIKTCQQKFT